MNNAYQAKNTQLALDLNKIFYNVVFLSSQLYTRSKECNLNTRIHLQL